MWQMYLTFSLMLVEETLTRMSLDNDAHNTMPPSLSITTWSSCLSIYNILEIKDRAGLYC